MKGYRERCMASGMAGYLSEPIRPQELHRLPEKYVSLKRERLQDLEPVTRK